jgi:DNA-binding CsgD family transcriptional regulator
MSPPPTVASLASPLHEAIRSSSLSIALVRLPTRRFVELSQRAAKFFGGEPRVLRGTDALAVSDEQEASGRAWDAIADGLLDGYHTQRSLRGGEHAIDSRIWVRVLPRTGADADAVVIVTPVHGEPDPTSADAPVDEQVLEELVAPFLEIAHPDDIATILTAIEEATTTRAHVTVVVRLRDKARSWQRLRLSVGPFDDETNQFGFALTVGDTTAPVPPGERAIELEQRLRRIAREVEAAGIVSTLARIPDPGTVPGLEDLTARQWEVVTRLTRGERVSEIARGMFLSPSTVRNHLANLFRKVGVHSQSEFLDLLRQHD